MAHDSSDQTERQVIADALSTLRILQREKLSFPDAIDLEHTETPASGVEPVKRRGAVRTVLVVDDNPTILRSVSQAFLSDGFGVCATADSGADAIDLVERLNPDVIILDLSMPVMNGLQTACRLRKIAPVTPIILFKLYGHELPIEQAAAIGVNLVLSKTDNIFSVVSKARELVEAFLLASQPDRNLGLAGTHFRQGEKCRARVSYFGLRDIVQGRAAIRGNERGWARPGPQRRQGVGCGRSPRACDQARGFYKLARKGWTLATRRDSASPDLVDPRYSESNVELKFAFDLITGHRMG